MYIRQPTLSVILCLGFALSAPTVSDALEFQVTPEGVTIEDVTPGGEVAVTWAARHYGVVPQTSWDTFVATDDDCDGVIVLADLDRATLAGALWAVVDVNSGLSGAYRLGIPTEPAVDITQGAHDLGGTVESSQTIAAPGGRVSLLLIRPGVGAWHTEVYDGTQNDHDGAQNHVVTTSAALLGPGGRAPEAPASTQIGDLIIGLDSRAMIVTISTVS